MFAKLNKAIFNYKKFIGAWMVDGKKPLDAVVVKAKLLRKESKISQLVNQGLLIF